MGLGLVKKISIGKIRHLSNTNVIPINKYKVFTLGFMSVRKGIRDGEFVIDKTLTTIGFTGIENIDWENISGMSINN